MSQASVQLRPLKYLDETVAARGLHAVRMGPLNPQS